MVTRSSSRIAAAVTSRRFNGRVVDPAPRVRSAASGRPRAGAWDVASVARTLAGPGARMRDRVSASARARARLERQLAQQTLAIPGVARGPVDEIGVGGDEGQIEQLGIGLLLHVDLF